ncbi:hypothetical protein [Bacteroides sp.]|uniref:hypothetical protein n=1 Tax=Bacteroides sp. TaxID=29523 RepID=UPI0025C2AC91|nr:hypothetical protein [Bacteroides sp.]
MKKNINLIIYFMFMFNNFVYSYGHDECLLIQRDTSIILSNIENQTECLLLNVMPNSRFDIACLNGRKYIVIYDEQKKILFKTKKINQYSSDMYMLNKDSMLLHIGQMTCNHLDSNKVSKVYNMKINNKNENYIQYEFSMVLDKEQDRFPFYKSNTIKGMTIYSSGGNLYMQNNNRITLLIENTLKNNPKAMNGLYYPYICNDGKKVCFSWKKRMMDKSYYIYEYTFCDNKVVELPVKGTFPIYSPNGNYLLVKKSHLFYVIYSFKEKKVVKEIKGCFYANWVAL